MTPSFERRLLQVVVAVAGCVPVGAGAWGVMGGLDRGHAWVDSQGRYLSGLLLGIGLVFWAMIPTLERRGAAFRALALIVFIGGLARLWGAIPAGFPQVTMFPLMMELGLTPALALWRERVERRQAPLADRRNAR